MNKLSENNNIPFSQMKSISRNDFIGHNNSFIYILTSNKYEPENIYKIGYSYDVTKRVKEINYTVNDIDDKFFCVFYLYFPNSLIKRVERTIHKIFASNLHEWELFKGDLKEFIHVICCLHDFIYLS